MNLTVYTHARKEEKNALGQVENPEVKESKRDIRGVTFLELDFERKTFTARYKNAAGVTSIESGELSNLTKNGEIPDFLFDSKSLGEAEKKKPEIKDDDHVAKTLSGMGSHETPMKPAPGSVEAGKGLGVGTSNQGNFSTHPTSHVGNVTPSTPATKHETNPTNPTKSTK